MVQLIRWRLSAMVALSALAGLALRPGALQTEGAALVAGGIFLLAGGCSALNQVQERHIDARMARTRHRPLAAGRLRPAVGLAVALVLSAAGLFLLAHTGSIVAVGLGGFALLWYNGLYTWLKRKTVFAILPGALCGALPPLIGWSAVGGSPSDYRIVIVTGLFLLWQIPHFWLLAARHREDFARAGLPCIYAHLNRAQVARLALVWFLALVVGVLQLLAFSVVRQPAAAACLGLLVLWGLGCAGHAFWRKLPLERLYPQFNLFMGLIVVTLLLEGLLY